MLQSIFILTFTHPFLPQGIVGTALVIGIMAVIAGMSQSIFILTFTHLLLRRDCWDSPGDWHHGRGCWEVTIKIYLNIHPILLPQRIVGAALVICIMAVIAGMLQPISIFAFTRLLLLQGIVGTALVIGIMTVITGMLQSISIWTPPPPPSILLPQRIVVTALVICIMAVIAGMLQSISILTFTPYCCRRALLGPPWWLASWPWLLGCYNQYLS